MRGVATVAVCGVLVVGAACSDDDASGTPSGSVSASASSSSGSSSGSSSSSTGGSGGAASSAAHGSGGQGGTPQGGAGQGGTGGGGPGGGTGNGGAGGSADFYGALSGTCGEVNDDDVLSDDPQYLANAIDFSARAPFDVAYLTAGGLEIWNDGNLGGSSIHSEIFAYEVLSRCDGALLLKTEGEIVYQTPGKKTDLLVEIDGQRVGVSVVRAMSFPKGAPYPVAQAYDLLEGKLSDILESSVNVDPADAWPKQILSVIAQTPDHADALEAAWASIPAPVASDTIVFVTVTEGDDDFIYYE